MTPELPVTQITQRISSATILSNFLDPETLFSLEVNAVAGDLWNSALRPDIKPGRVYELTVMFREVDAPRGEE